MTYDDKQLNRLAWGGALITKNPWETLFNCIDDDSIIDKSLPTKAQTHLRHKAQQIKNSHPHSDHTSTLQTLRRRLNNDWFIAPKTDHHLGEETPSAFDRLRHLTGFTGSAGLCLVGPHKAVLVVDERYILQGRTQTDSNLFDVVLYKDLASWLTTHKPDLTTPITYDPWTLCSTTLNLFTPHTCVGLDHNPLDIDWHHRPPRPLSAVFMHDYTTHNPRQIMQNVCQVLAQHKADSLLITQPDAICWLLGVRAADYRYSPLPLCFGRMDSDGQTTLYIESQRLLPPVINYLNTINVLLKPYDDFFTEALCLSSFIINKAACPLALAALPAAHIIPHDPIQLAKSHKAEADKAHIINAHLKDGAAFVTFAHWLYNRMDQSIPTTELDTLAKITDLRLAQPLGYGASFHGIAGAGSNGAIIHYTPTQATDRPLDPTELFLLDTGGQYLDGTTDMSRVFCFAAPTNDQKRDYTLVLKGHLALLNCHFPMGTTGQQLDALGRQALWNQGMDYGHGTGHGVGFFMNVHEDPQRITPQPPQVPLNVGMVLSVEPGYYKEGHYGIRIENLVIVTLSDHVNFLTFQNLTWAPYERKLIDKTYLTTTEINQINTYHQTTKAHLKPHLSPDLYDWLHTITKPL
jgi:Xaa-Pro aminopeptidase